MRYHLFVSFSLFSAISLGIASPVPMQSSHNLPGQSSRMPSNLQSTQLQSQGHQPSTGANLYSKPRSPSLVPFPEQSGDVIDSSLIQQASYDPQSNWFSHHHNVASSDLHSSLGYSSLVHQHGEEHASHGAGSSFSPLHGHYDEGLPPLPMSLEAEDVNWSSFHYPQMPSIERLSISPTASPANYGSASDTQHQQNIGTNVPASSNPPSSSQSKSFEGIHSSTSHFLPHVPSGFSSFRARTGVRQPVPNQQTSSKDGRLPSLFPLNLQQDQLLSQLGAIQSPIQPAADYNISPRHRSRSPPLQQRHPIASSSSLNTSSPSLHSHKLTDRQVPRHIVRSQSAAGRNLDESVQLPNFDVDMSGESFDRVLAAKKAALAQVGLHTVRLIQDAYAKRFDLHLPLDYTHATRVTYNMTNEIIQAFRNKDQRAIATGLDDLGRAIPSLLFKPKHPCDSVIPETKEQQKVAKVLGKSQQQTASHGMAILRNATEDESRFIVANLNNEQALLRLAHSIRARCGLL